MANILDYSFARPDPGTIKSSGFEGVMRYLAPQPNGKVITQSELNLLRGHGLAVGFVWETTANRALDGRAAGVSDANAALAQANALGVPSSVPIFFAVDFDVTPEQQAAVNAYFQGVSSVIGVNRTGMYGGYWPLSRAFDASVIKWGWQTYAWSGGNWDNRAQLRQTENGQWNGQVDFGVTMNGLDGLWAPSTPQQTNNQGEDMVDQATLDLIFQSELGRMPDPGAYSHYVGHYTTSFTVKDVHDSQEGVSYRSRLAQQAQDVTNLNVQNGSLQTQIDTLSKANGILQSQLKDATTKLIQDVKPPTPPQPQPQPTTVNTNTPAPTSVAIKDTPAGKGVRTGLQVTAAMSVLSTIYTIAQPILQLPQAQNLLVQGITTSSVTALLAGVIAYMQNKFEGRVK